MQRTGTEKRELGNQGEELACKLLADSGCTIVERNFRIGENPHDPEVDVIVQDGDALVFVEVRSQTTDYLATPALTVNERKQRQVVLAARLYLQRCKPLPAQVRFDVVAVSLGSGPPGLEWIKDAFRPPSSARAWSFTW
jgi:putative endonuclease